MQCRIGHMPKDSRVMHPICCSVLSGAPQYVELGCPDDCGTVTWGDPSYCDARTHPQVAFDICEGSWQTQMIDELGAQDGDSVFLECRSRAFAGSCLGMMLRGRGIRRLVIAISGCHMSYATNDIPDPQGSQH